MSGSVGNGDGPRLATPGSLTPGGLLAGSKAPRRLLPDSSAGPTIGTRPDSAASSISGSASGTASASGAVGLRGGLMQAGGTGHVTVNGVVKKVGPNGFVAGGTSSDNKVVVQRDGDKVVVRQLPGTAAPGPFSASSPST